MSDLSLDENPRFYKENKRPPSSRRGIHARVFGTERSGRLCHMEEERVKQLLPLTKELAAVIDKALVRNPKDRFPDAGKLLASLPKPRT